MAKGYAFEISFCISLIVYSNQNSFLDKLNKPITYVYNYKSEQNLSLIYDIIALYFNILLCK